MKSVEALFPLAPSWKNTGVCIYIYIIPMQRRNSIGPPPALRSQHLYRYPRTASRSRLRHRLRRRREYWFGPGGIVGLSTAEVVPAAQSRRPPPLRPGSRGVTPIHQSRPGQRVFPAQARPPGASRPSPLCTTATLSRCSGAPIARGLGGPRMMLRAESRGWVVVLVGARCRAASDASRTLRTQGRSRECCGASRQNATGSPR